MSAMLLGEEPTPRSRRRGFPATWSRVVACTLMATVASLTGCGSGATTADPTGSSTATSSTATSSTATSSTATSSTATSTAATSTTSTASTDSGGTPPVDNGNLGAGSGSHRSTGSHRANEAVVIVGGPTVDGDYPEYWGNLYLGTRSQCAVFTNEAATYPERVESVTVSGPVMLVRGCTPTSGSSGHVSCRVGAVLPVGGGGGCTIGIALPAGTNLHKNYVGANEWVLSVSCHDARAVPCSAASVAARHPSASAAVKVRWTVSFPYRFCGGTDYADDRGAPGGTGSKPGNGCSASKPSADGSSSDGGSGGGSSSGDSSSDGSSSGGSPSGDSSSGDSPADGSPSS